MSSFWGSIKNFGLIEGLSLYIKLKNFQRDSITTSKLPHKIHLRPGSTDNCVFKQIFLEQDLNISILKKIKIETIMDLGANIGMSSLYMAHRFPDARIIGVEPNEANGKMFKMNLSHYSNVDFILGAVRGNHEKLEINDYGMGATGYVAEPTKLVGGMPSITISDIMKKYQWDKIDILKMDIEGSEKSVFERNYEEWLPLTKILLVELHERKSPGCTNVIRNAISNYNFTWQKSGEYEVLINNDLV